MKKLWDILVLTLAVNFLAVAGGVAYLHQTGRLTRERVAEIGAVLYPPPATDAPTTRPVEAADAATQPVLRLEQLLAEQSGRPATEQVEFIRRSFDAQMAQLDRRQRELADLQRQVALARDQMERDRLALAEAEADLDARATEAAKLASDQGFQDSLELYNTMPARQVKTIFMSLDDRTVQQYLQAMQPRTATKIIKEFKTPDELERVQRVLENMRRADAAKSDAAAAAPSKLDGLRVNGQ